MRSIGLVSDVLKVQFDRIKKHRRWATAIIGTLVLVAGWSIVSLLSPGSGKASADTLALCGNPGPAPVATTHVIVVMMENLSYKQVVGSANAPYQTSLASQCGVGTAMFGSTHTSAANYLSVSAGEYPAGSPAGCGSVKACSDSSDNLYHQMDTAGLSWRSYEESMSTPCNPKSADPYKIGHNPAIFYTDIPGAECQANDLPVADLTAQSGALWNDLQNQTLPSLSWVTPNEDNDGEGGSGGVGERAGDTWLQHFLATVQGSNSYQAGNTVVLITYDEGTGSDTTQGEDCTNQSLDMPVANGTSAHQDSCHVPFFVVDPYTPAGTSDGTFFDHYSITKTVEDLFSLSYLGHAGDSQTASLVGHFGLTTTIATPTPTPTPPPSDTPSPTPTDTPSPTPSPTDTPSPTPSPSPSPSPTPNPTINYFASCDASVELNLSCFTGVYTGTSKVTWVTGIGEDGTHSAQITSPTSTTAAAGLNAKIGSGFPINNATTPNVTLTGSVWVKAGAIGQKLNLILRERDANNVAPANGYTTASWTATDTNWHQLTDIYTTKTTGDSLTYSVYATTLAAGQSFWADEFSLTSPGM